MGNSGYELKYVILFNFIPVIQFQLFSSRFEVPNSINEDEFIGFFIWIYMNPAHGAGFIVSEAFGIEVIIVEAGNLCLELNYLFQLIKNEFISFFMWVFYNLINNLINTSINILLYGVKMNQ